MKIKLSGNGKITLSFTEIGKSCPLSRIFNLVNMSLNAFRENKILAFTVYKV